VSRLLPYGLTLSSSVSCRRDRVRPWLGIVMERIYSITLRDDGFFRHRPPA